MIRTPSTELVPLFLVLDHHSRASKLKLKRGSMPRFGRSRLIRGPGLSMTGKKLKTILVELKRWITIPCSNAREVTPKRSRMSQKVQRPTEQTTRF